MDSLNLTPTQMKSSEILSPQCSSATLPLKRTLQRHIKSLLNALPSLEAAEKDGEKHIVALANLLEQRECVDRVKEIDGQMVTTFGDLKARLSLKISTEVEKEIEFLTNSLIPLKGLKQVLQQARGDVLSLASSPTAKDIDPATMYEGTPIIPPLVAVIDLIQAVEKEVRELYCSRTYYLENLSDENRITSDSLHELWMEDSSKVASAIKDCREIVKYFLEEKV